MSPMCRQVCGLWELRMADQMLASSACRTFSYGFLSYMDDEYRATSLHGDLPACNTCTELKRHDMECAYNGGNEDKPDGEVSLHIPENQR